MKLNARLQIIIKMYNLFTFFFTQVTFAIDLNVTKTYIVKTFSVIKVHNKEL